MAGPRAFQPSRAAAVEGRKLTQAMSRLPLGDSDDDYSDEEVPIKLTKRQQAKAKATKRKRDDDDAELSDLEDARPSNAQPTRAITRPEDDTEQHEQEDAGPTNRTNILPTREVIPNAELPVIISCFFNVQVFTHEVCFSFGECDSIATIQKLVDDHFQHEWRRVDLPETTVFVQLNCFAPKRPGEPDDEFVHLPCRTETMYQVWWQRIMASKVYLGERARIQVCLDTDAFLAADKERLQGWPSRADGSAEGPVDNTYGPRWVRKARMEFEKSLSGMIEPLSWDEAKEGGELKRERKRMSVPSYVFRQNERGREIGQEVAAKERKIKEESKGQREANKQEKAVSANLLEILREEGVRVRKSKETGLHYKV